MYSDISAQIGLVAKEDVRLNHNYYKNVGIKIRTSGLRLQDSLPDVDELVLVVLGEDGELSAERGGVVVLALVRLAARVVHQLCVHPGPEKSRKSKLTEEGWALKPALVSKSINFGDAYSLHGSTA